MNIIDYFAKKYPYENEYLAVKARHTVFVILLIISWVFIEEIVLMISSGTEIHLLLVDLFVVLIFVGMLFLVRMGRLVLSGNIFIVAGIFKLVQYLPMDSSHAFYLQCAIIIALTTAVYTKRYQWYIVVGFTMGISLFRIPYLVHLVANSPVYNSAFMLQTYQATVGILLLILIIRFYDMVLTSEIINTKEIKELAEIDMLTHLYNRQVFEKKIAEPFDERGCIAMLDIDDFKQVNDFYGHIKGDEVLEKFALQMKIIFKDSELLFRWGGEEFVILCRDGDSELFSKKLEMFRQSIESLDFGMNEHVTVSIGFICLKSNTQREKALVHADKALYSAKIKGKNRIERVDYV